MTHSSSVSETYSVIDIETTFRRFRSDIFMIADSTQAITRAEAEEYAHDAEYLARRGFLKKVDVTLLSNGVEQKAACYIVNEESGSLESSRPGGVLWPQVTAPRIRIILSYTDKYTAEKKAATQPSLKINWCPTTEDISHSSLTSLGGRNYVSGAYGLQRKDFA